MNRKVVWSTVFFLLNVGAVCAADAAAGEMGFFFGATELAAVIGVGLAAGGCGVGMGMCFAAGLQGIARQPELTSKLLQNMMIGAAFIESLVLYTLFLAIIVLFANPFATHFIAH